MDDLTTNTQLTQLTPAYLQLTDETQALFDLLPEDSIFRQSSFPFRTRPHKIKPIQIFNLLTSYQHSNINFETICHNSGINGHQEFFPLCTLFPEILTYYRRSQELRTETMAQKSLEIADNSDNDAATVSKTHRDGSVTTYEAPNMAAVRRSELQVKARQWMIERLNPAYAAKNENKNVNLNVNVNARVLKITDIGNINFDDID